MSNEERLMNPDSPIEKMIAQKVDEKREFIDRAEKDLAPISHRGKLPEKHFKEVFVPFLVGQVDSTPENNLVNCWIAVAGSPASEMDVIDDEGNVLFTAPPLYDTSLINAGAPAERTLGSIMQEYSQIKQDIPQAAESFLNQHMANKFNNMMHKPSDVPLKSERWENILSRYGHAPAKTGADGSSQTSGQDELNYDEVL